MSEHLEFELLDALALGTLDPAETTRVAAHLNACSECRREYDELRSVIDLLPHALPQETPPAELGARITAAVAETRAARPRLPVAGALAAALLLALAGDAYFAFAFHARAARQIANVTASATPAPASPAPARATSPPIQPTPHATPRTTAHETRSDGAVIAALQRRLARAQSTAGTDALQIALLERELAAARKAPRIVRIFVTPPPVAVHSAPPQRVALASPAPRPSVTPSADADLVSALRTGKVYAVDGVVDGDPWHLTIVQPRDGTRAVIFSGTPGAPAGDTYRTWVIRDGRTFDAGELPPQQPTTLEMPMALQTGDIVAFSREPVGTGDLPTQPFLMQVKITQ